MNDNVMKNYRTADEWLALEPYLRKLISQSYTVGQIARLLGESYTHTGTALKAMGLESAIDQLYREIKERKNALEGGQ